MLKSIRCHSDYQDFLQRSLPACLKEKFVAPKKAKRLVTAMWLLNYDAIIPSMQSLFPSNGRPARDPVSMLRSLVLMHLAGFHSITKWVECIQFNDLFLNLSGFELNDSPGVGSFYDFINRLWSDKTDYFNDDHLRVFNSRPRKVKFDASGKMSSTRKPGVVNRLVAKSIAGRRFSRDPARFLKSFFAELAVKPSIKNGIIKSVEDSFGNAVLSSPVGGDGTAVKSFSNRYGIKVCNCVENRIYNCKCPRRFSDYHANSGWDSHNKLFFFGHTFYFLTTPDSDLPLYLNVAQASRHDSVQGVVALTEFNDLHHNISTPRTCWDSAHDSLSFYALNTNFGSEPFIDLKRKPKENTKLDCYGRPICDAGLVMVNGGWCPDRLRHKWRCPKTAGNAKLKTSACLACTKNCSASIYGRTIYTYPERNTRLFTKTPRSSKAWKTTYNSRSSCERLNKKVLVDYQLEHCRVRSQKHWYVRGFLISICLDLDVWVKNSVCSVIRPLNLLSAA